MGSFSHALPRSKMLRFQDVPEYTVPESHGSGSRDHCSVISQVGHIFVHGSGSVWSVSQILYKDTVHDELCISSEELISGYDTLGSYKLSQIPGSHG